MEPNAKVKRRWLIGAGAAALVSAGAGAVWWWRRRQPPGILNAALVQGDLPLADPDSKLWRKGDDQRVPLLAQKIALPWLAQPTIKDFTVRALYNGKQLGFLLEWTDDRVHELENIVNFRDAVAAMLPLNPAGDLPPVFMGMQGRPVYILQWKASWQKDQDQGFQDTEKSFPNMYNDVYPGHPTLEQLGLKGDVVKQFYPGLYANNPLSRQTRASPVEELLAEGFSTLTSLPEQRAMGRGVYAKGRWKVAMGVPAEGANLPALKAGQSSPAAFAIWDGGKQQRGGRKHYANWIQLNLPGG